MTGYSTFDAGMIVAMEAGRDLAESGREKSERSLRELLARAGLSAPSADEIERSFQIRVQRAADEVRDIGLARGLTIDQAAEVAGALMVAANAGKTQ